MPATPAWPPRSAPRLFVAAPLAKGATVDGRGQPGALSRQGHARRPKATS